MRPEHTHTHSLTHLHTHIHAHAHTHLHTHLHTHSLTLTHTHTHTCLLVQSSAVDEQPPTKLNVYMQRLADLREKSQISPRAFTGVILEYIRSLNQHGVEIDVGAAAWCTPR